MGDCTWCSDKLQENAREPGTAGGPKLGYRLDLCLWCNKLINLCTSGFHFPHTLADGSHRCGKFEQRDWDNP